MTKKPIMALRNVTKRFGDKVVLAGVNFDIEENKIHGIIGRSGCGKTTLLNTVMGFLKANEGLVIYGGKDVSKNKKLISKKFGFASQVHSFYNKLSVKENIAYFGKLYGLDSKLIKERTNFLLGKFNLMHDKKTLGENLSSGMKKRLDIACALIHNPEVLLLDEPTADLDPMMRGEILNLIKDIKEAGTTVLVTTHLMGEIEKLCDRVFLINHHRVIDVGTPEDFDRHYSKSLTLRFDSRDYFPVLNSIKEFGHPIQKVLIDGDNLVIHSKNAEEVMQHVVSFSKQSGDKISFINLEKPNLDRIFEQITTRMD
jgi:ABC-2 type transport system ATP-binding protein